MTVFLMVHVGIEMTMATFITTLAVTLGFSKIVGTHLTAIFWAAFALGRLLAIFAAVKVNAFLTLVFSFIVSIVGAGLLIDAAMSGNESILVLQAKI